MTKERIFLIRKDCFKISKYRKRVPWNEREDTILRSLINQYGSHDWHIISTKLNLKLEANNRRNPQQCKERWKNKFQSNSRKFQETFTQDDEKKLFEYQAIFGNKWAKIAKHFPGINENNLKNYYYSQIRKKIRRTLIQLKKTNFFELNKVNLDEGNVGRIQFFLKKEKLNFFYLSTEKIQNLILKYKGIPLERLVIKFQNELFKKKKSTPTYKRRLQLSPKTSQKENGSYGENEDLKYFSHRDSLLNKTSSNFLHSEIENKLSNGIDYNVTKFPNDSLTQNGQKGEKRNGLDDESNRREIKYLGIKRKKGYFKQRKKHQCLNQVDKKTDVLDDIKNQNIFFYQPKIDEEVIKYSRIPETLKGNSNLSDMQKLNNIQNNLIKTNNSIPTNDLNYNMFSLNNVIQQSNLQNLLLSNLLASNENSNLYNQNILDKINPSINMNYNTLCAPLNNFNMNYNPLLARNDLILNQISTPIFNPLQHTPNNLFYNNLINAQNDNFLFNYNTPMNNTGNLFLNDIQYINPITNDNKMFNHITINSNSSLASQPNNVTNHSHNTNILNQELNRLNDNLFIKNNIYNRIIASKKEDDFNPFYNIDHKETNEMIRNQHIDEFLKEKIIEKKEMDRMTCSKF